MLKKISPVVVVGLLLTIGCLSFYISGSSLIQAISNYAYDRLICYSIRYDTYFRRVDAKPKSDRVVIVDLDDKSLGRTELGQWPWPRYLVSEMTRKILDAGASVVAFDVVFAERDRTSPVMIRTNMNSHFNLDVELKGVPNNLLDFDEIFAATLAKGKTILGCAMSPTDEPLTNIDLSFDPYFDKDKHIIVKGKGAGKSYILQSGGIAISIKQLLKTSRSAFFNAIPDSDNIVRSNPLVWAYGPDRIYPSLAMEALRLDMNIERDRCFVDYDECGITQIRLKDLVVPTDNVGRLIINFRDVNKEPKTGFVSSFPVFTAWEVISGAFSASSFSNKIVFIGTSAVGLKDRRATPVTKDFSGVEIHATMIDNMLAGDMLQIPNWIDGANFVAIFVMGVFLTFFISRGRSWLSFVVSIVMVISSILFSWFVLKVYNGVFVPVWVILSIIIIYPTLTMIKFWQEELQKKRVRDMFGTMVSERVLHFLENNPESFSLTGQRREATMFFSDVAGFTTISENLPPNKLSELLNKYLSPMTHLIMDRNGYVDKYEGDAIMAVWGVPYPMDNHATEACLAALEQQAKLAEIRPKLNEEYGHDIHVRMGLNSGVVTAGNMGSDRKFQYTVMGDAVNQAARLEPANKIYNTLIIIGETTYNEAKNAIEARYLDKMIVKGKTKPISIYELLAVKGGLSAEKMKVIELYEEALRLHWARKWDESIKLLENVLELDQRDGPSAKLLSRIQQYRESPPPEGWSGEFLQLNK
ncbi:MAG: adenylate/guanylate cyclase domain-containing protein [Kiritimatiellae bacterium]|nr:adenylate/guanylate cyclase domain-containing protein [Kiritimatiellia bacterium]